MFAAMLHWKLYSAFAVEIEASKIRKQQSISVRRFNDQDKYQDASEDISVADKPVCQVDFVFSNLGYANYIVIFIDFTVLYGIENYRVY